MIKRQKNWGFQAYLENLGVIEYTDYNLWKFTRKQKRPHIAIPPTRIDYDNWARNENNSHKYLLAT